jgi:hypothetical protein
MCYSAQIQADYRKYVRMFGAHMSIREFAQLYWERAEGSNVRIPKAMDAAFSVPQSDEERRIKEAIDRFNGEQATKLEQELFKQRARLADAERTLQGKTTKAATESKRIATSKIESALRGLDDLRRTELKDRDSRIFPGNYAPVMVIEDGKRVIKPMRYHCRPAGKPAFYDKKYPGTYNARFDNLEGFWKGLFGYSHGLIVANAFYENVKRHRLEGRELAEGEQEENVVLEFKPQPAQDMLIACLWSHYTGRPLASRTFCHSRPSPMSRHRRLRPRVMIAAPSRSSRRISMRGSAPSEVTSRHNMRFSTTAIALTMNIEWRPKLAG